MPLLLDRKGALMLFREALPREHCGLFGIVNNKHASWLTYLGLYALQHRGQEACGIVAHHKGILSLHKGTGLVSDCFNEQVLRLRFCR